MENYSEYETEEKKKFQITRGMVILAAIILVILIVVIVIIVNFVNSKKPKYTTEDFIKLESRMEEETLTYLSQKRIELTSEEIKIDLKELLLENGGSIDSSKVKAAKVCEGYVIASKQETENYDAYINCEDYYITNGYVSSNKTTTKATTTTKKDTEKPVITLIGESTLTINSGTSYNDEGAKATDNIDGDITSKINVSGSVDTSKSGTYILTYTVSDNAGNRAEKTRKITVVDVATTTSPKATTNSTTKKKTTTKVKTTTKKVTTAPTITLKGSDYMNINQGNIWKDPGYSARDSLGNDITIRVSVSGSVNTSVAGTYRIIYSVTDSYGNSSSKSRTVIVKSNEIKLQSISLTPNSFSLSVGGNKTLIVSYNPSNATNKTITWSSSNPTVADVSNGVVTGKKTGTATITAKGSNGVTASVSVTVK